MSNMQNNIQKTVAIILSGGTGTRLGSSIPKQYIEVKGRMIISYSMEVLLNSEYIDGVLIVADRDYHEKIENEINSFNNASTLKKKFIGFAMPGNTRQLSIYNALIELKNKNVKTVFIHDAARPNITQDMVREYILALNENENCDGILPVLPMKDTVYSVDNGKIVGLINRSLIYAGQAPEIFIYDKYLEANEKLMPDEILKINGSTEVAVKAGMNIKTVEGLEKNFKITTKEDLDRFISLKN